MAKSQFFTTYIENARLRLTIDRIDRPPENIIENLAFRICFSIFRAFNYLGNLKPPENRAWRIGKGAFAAVLGVYIMQVSPLSSNWSVFLGVGLAAYYAACSTHKQPKEGNVLSDAMLTNAGSNGLISGEVNGKLD